MVIVPSFCPDVPALRKNPVFLLHRGRLQEAQPVRTRRRRADRCAIELKVACIDALGSQFYEWNPWLFGYLAQVPKEKARAAGVDTRPNSETLRFMADQFRPKLIELLGRRKRKGGQICRGLRDL